MSKMPDELNCLLFIRFCKRVPFTVFSHYETLINNHVSLSRHSKFQVKQNSADKSSFAFLCFHNFTQSCFVILLLSPLNERCIVYRQRIITFYAVYYVNYFLL